MSYPRIFSAVACAALLTACAAPASTPASQPASMATVLGDADAAAKAGRQDQAYAMLKAAAASAPRDKTPLLRIAQMHFDDKNYGEAIVSGLQALERDPNDILANSLVAVSGLRVSSKALGELTRKNKLNGDVKSEAQDLARLLRSSLNEDVLVPRPKAPQKPRPTSTAAATAAPAKSGSSSSDPFGALK